MGDNKMINNVNKKVMIAVGIFIALIVITTVIYLAFSSPATKKDPTKDPSYTVTYVDPGSGETVISTPNKTPENTNGAIVMLGFSKLTSNYGMTFDQVKKLQSELSEYSSTLKTPIKEISITLASITTSVNQDTGDVVDRFTITIDRTSTLTATVSYFGIDNPTLNLYNPKTNKLIFTSK